LFVPRRFVPKRRTKGKSGMEDPGAGTGVDKKTLKILKYGRPHKGPRKRRKGGGGRSGPSGASRGPKRPLPVLQEEDETGISALPSYSAVKNEHEDKNAGNSRLNGHGVAYMQEYRGDGRESGSTMIGKGHKDFSGTGISHHRLQRRSSSGHRSKSRLPLVNAQETANLAAYAVLGADPNAPISSLEEIAAELTGECLELAMERSIERAMWRIPIVYPELIYSHYPFQHPPVTVFHYYPPTPHVAMNTAQMYPQSMQQHHNFGYETPPVSSSWNGGNGSRNYSPLPQPPPHPSPSLPRNVNSYVYGKRKESIDLESLVSDLAKVLPDPSIAKRNSLGTFSPRVSALSSMSNFWEGSESSISSEFTSSRERDLRWIQRLYDPFREKRVDHVVMLAEEERKRRTEESLQSAYKDQLERAKRLEWAIIATEKERSDRLAAEKAFQREINRNRKRTKSKILWQEEGERVRRVRLGASADIVLNAKKILEDARKEQLGLQGSSDSDSESNEDAYTEDYEVMCPYAMIGCEVTCMRSEAEQHLKVCSFRARSEKEGYDGEKELMSLYNPLEFVVDCPYKVVGCSHACRRVDLLDHLRECDFRDDAASQLEQAVREAIENPQFDFGGYDVVCPYATWGCPAVVARSQIERHLNEECAYTPPNRQEEEADRQENVIKVVEAAEDERKRRLTGDDPAANEQIRAKHFKNILKALIEESMIDWSKSSDMNGSEVSENASHSRSFTVSSAHSSSSSSSSSQSDASSESSCSVASRMHEEMFVEAGSPLIGKMEGDTRSSQSSSSGIPSGHTNYTFSPPPSPAQMLGKSASTPAPKIVHHNRNSVASFQSLLSLQGEESSQEGAKSMDSAFRNRESLINEWNAEWIYKAVEIEALRKQVEKDAMRKARMRANSGIEQQQDDIANGECECDGLRKSRSFPRLSILNSEEIWREKDCADIVDCPRSRSRSRSDSQGTLTSVPVEPFPKRSSTLEFEIGERRKERPALAHRRSRSTELLHRDQFHKSQIRRSSSDGRPVGPPHLFFLVEHMEQQLKNLYNRLDGEFRSLVEICEQENVKYKAAIEEIKTRIQRIATGCFGEKVQALVFGSYATGLAVPGLSDVDLVLFTQRGLFDVNGASRCVILGRVIKHRDWIKSLQVLDRAKMPLIKLTTEPKILEREFNVDVSIALPSHGGAQTAAYVMQLCKSHPELKPLILVIKKLLAEKGLNDPFTGGLSSYALVLMVVASLNRHSDHAGPRCLGENFLDFLQLYGCEFDPEESAIRVISTSNFEAKTTVIGQRHHSSHEVLVVEDPVQLGNNIARSCFRFHDVMNVFSDLFAKLLSKTVRIGDSGEGGSLLNLAS